MDYSKIAILSIGLGMDVMSVCAGVGVKWHGAGQKFRLAWHMGLFQFVMTVAGWHGGKVLADLFRDFGPYLAAALVFLVGAKMLVEAIRSRPGALAERIEHKADETLHPSRSDPTRGWSLLILSVATSIDALVVGFSLGLKGERVWIAGVAIGLVAGVMAILGVAIGKLAGKALGKWAEIIGALMLMGLGVSFVWL